MTELTRAGQVRAAALWDAIAAAAGRRAQTYRAELEAQARTELEQHGTAPSWTIPGLGKVPLSMSQDAVEVADVAAYTTWVAGRYPDNVEVRVRPAFDKSLRERLAKSGEPLCDDEGTVVPGLVFRRGGKPGGIRLVLDDRAKSATAAAAEFYLDALPPLDAMPDLDH